MLISALYKSFTYLLTYLLINFFKNRPVFRFQAGGRKRRPNMA